MITKKHNDDKFQKLVSKTPSGFIARQELDRKNRKSKLRSAQLAFSVLAILDHKNMTKTELAQKMNVSAQQVSKLLNGKNNFTFETVAKLEDALDIELIIICKLDFEREERKVEFIMKAMNERTIKVKSTKKSIPDKFATKDNFNSEKTVGKNIFSSLSLADKNLQPTG